jgi:hypothetical protein
MVSITFNVENIEADIFPYGEDEHVVMAQVKFSSSNTLEEVRDHARAFLLGGNQFI